MNADQVSKMSTAMTTVLKTGYKISCLVSGKCEVCKMNKFLIFLEPLVLFVQI